MPKPGEMDPFLASMTFAMGVQRDCDCDECGLCLEPNPVPPSIADAVREHKRMKMSMDRASQDRKLVAREGAFSVWRQTLPEGAEPMVEYGNSHRLVFVEKIASKGVIKVIGEGIVGSRAEEEGRRAVHWEERKTYVIRSNGGKALGWTNERSTSKEKTEIAGNTKGHENDKEEREATVVYMIKAMPDALEESDTNGADKGWVGKIREIFIRALSSQEEALENKECSTLADIVAELSSDS